MLKLFNSSLSHLKLFFLLSLVFSLSLALTGWSGSGFLEEAEGASATPRFSVLVFSKTGGFRHASIPSGVKALKRLGAEHDFRVTVTEDPTSFTPSTLAQYEAVAFLNTTGGVLDTTQQAAFEEYIQSGGGFVGIHAAADTEHEWAWYGGLVGARPENPSAQQPEQQEAMVSVADRAHPSTKHLPARWTHLDAWYNYQANPRGDVHVLAAVDEQSYEGGEMGYDHPIAWAHQYDGGRAWYTGMGHAEESYAEELFLKHVLGGIEWAAGAAEGDAAATVAGSFEKVVLDDQITYPMELEVAPDGRVFFIERDGAVKVWHPETRSTHMAGFIPVTTKIEDGLLGLALDPNFEENGWLYLYYSPLSEAPQRLSRFGYEKGRIDMESEQVMLEIPVQRELCCHAAGSIAFGPDGNLFLSTGDNTGGRAPRTDERLGRAYYDAQRTTADTHDLRGKILRITPQPDGSYTIPEGNLFEGDSLHRPEIYTMGHRNPWRISVDQETGWLYWGDVGPGNEAEEGRAPQGYDEFNQAREPGFFGWPYFVGPNEAYRDYNYATEEFGALPDPENPINDSPNSTGARELPPAQEAWIWYPYTPSEEFPQMGVGSMSASAGSIYHYDAETVGPHGLPAYYDDSVFIYEWARNWIKEVKLDENGDIMQINPFSPEMTFLRPIDIDIGPGGRMYVLEWGTPFWGSTRDAKLTRLDYYGSELRPPVAEASGTPTSGPVPLQVAFKGANSYSRNGDEPLSYTWDFDGDRAVDSRTGRPDPTFTYEEPGVYTALFTVTDTQGMSATSEVAVSAGNTAPTVSFEWPVEGGFFDFDEPIAYRVSAADPEDDQVAGEQVIVKSYLGHNTHLHLLQKQTGLKGQFQIHPNDSNAPYIIDQFARLEVSYTDHGANGVASQASQKHIVLQPKHKEAENFASREGVEVEITANRQLPEFADSTEVYLNVEDGDYVSYSPVNLLNIDTLAFRVAPKRDGSIEVRLDNPSGRLLAEVPVEAVGGSSEDSEDPEEDSEDWTDLTVPITDPGGVHALFLVFRGPPGDMLLDLDWVEFNGQGIMDRAAYGSE